MTSDEAQKAISIDNLTKRFGDFVAVDGISFDVPKGQIFGFVGPNGSGKSTTIRMLCGIIAPTSGDASVLGYDVKRQPEMIKQHIGYMSQKFGLYQDLTVLENLTFYAGVYQVPEDTFEERIEGGLKFAELQDRRDQITGTLGVGYRQRLAFACATIHRPQLMFLDEPTAGVDPVTRSRFWDMLYEMSERGRTSFVTTHYMEEAERCHRLGFIYDGNIIALGPPSEVKDAHATLEEAFLALTRR